MDYGFDWLMLMYAFFKVEYIVPEKRVFAVFVIYAFRKKYIYIDFSVQIGLWTKQ